MRVAVGGLHVECSTYNPVTLVEEDFIVWRGDEIVSQPYFDVLKDFDLEYIPTFYARAVPGGPISNTTYSRFKSEFLTRLQKAGPLDGLYLAMHGAVYAEGFEDAEGDWLSAAREIVGDRCLIAVSYDLHGSMSQRIIDSIDIFSTYRTAPHIDVPETQRRSLKMLERALNTGERPLVAWVPIPVILNGEQTSTVDEPAATIYGGLQLIDAKEGVWDASLQVGYMWADEPRAGAAAVVTGTDPEILRRESSALAEVYWNARNEFRFGSPVGSISEGVRRARDSGTHPVILADSGDNPTAGGVGDRADVLKELLAQGLNDVIVAGIVDPPAVEKAYQAGQGTVITTTIGAALDPTSGSVPVEAKVKFLLETDKLRERQAVLDIRGIDVVVAARRRPYHNLADFHVLGLDPEQAATVVVKSGYLSPELAPIANPGFMMLSDGAVNQDHGRLRRDRKVVPSFPFDLDIAWTPAPTLSARVHTVLAP